MTAVFYLGILIVAVGALWTLIIASQTSIPWCLLVLLAPPVGGFIFAFLHWQEAKKPFLLQLGGCVLVIAAMKANPDLKLPWLPWR